MPRSRGRPALGEGSSPRIMIRLSQEMLDQVKARAGAEGVTISVVARNFITQGLVESVTRPNEA